MDIWQKIKNLLKKQKLIDAPKETPTHQSNLPNNKYTIERRDGSTVEISPILDEMRNQTFEQVYNRRINEMQSIPKFHVISIETDGNIRGGDILIDLSPKQLEDARFADYVANSLLGTKRMDKIINEYGNYAGCIRTDENGAFKKFKDQGIIDTLNASKEENARRVERDRILAEKSRNDAILKRAERRGVNIDDNQPENLSDQEWHR